MNKIGNYLTALLAGALMAVVPILIWCLKNAKPVINTASYVNELEQSVKKLKQSGDGNTVDLTGKTEEKKKPFLGIRLRKKNKP